MPTFLKCRHCDWLDYLDTYPNRCPKCGAATEEVAHEFEQESVYCKIMNADRKKVKVRVTFKMLEERFNAIVGNDLKEIFSDKSERSRLAFMMKAYLWILLKKSPQLWVYVDAPISGLKELMTLKVVGPRGKQ